MIELSPTEARRQLGTGPWFTYATVLPPSVADVADDDIAEVERVAEAHRRPHRGTYRQRQPISKAAVNRALSDAVVISTSEDVNDGSVRIELTDSVLIVEGS